MYIFILEKNTIHYRINNNNNNNNNNRGMLGFVTRRTLTMRRTSLAWYLLISMKDPDRHQILAYIIINLHLIVPFKMLQSKSRVWNTYLKTGTNMFCAFVFCNYVKNK